MWRIRKKVKKSQKRNELIVLSVLANLPVAKHCKELVDRSPPVNLL